MKDYGDRTKMMTIINLILLIWLLASPIFWRFELSKDALTYYDTFLMAPNGLFHLVAFYILILISILLSKVTLYHLLLLSLYFPVIQLVNYPLLTFRDVYLHAAPVEAILVNGKLVYPRSSAVESWPGSFLLHAILSIVTSDNTIITNYVLSWVLSFVFAIILYCFAKTLEKKDYKLARFSVVLFSGMLFSHLHIPITHYCRAFLADVFLLFFIHAFVAFENRVLRVFIVFAIIITHPFHSIALLSFTIFYSILAHTKETVNFVYFLATASVGWFLFNGAISFDYAINCMKKFLSPEYTATFIEAIQPLEILPWWGIFLRNLYKYCLLGLLFVSSFSVFLVIYTRYKYKVVNKVQLSLSVMLPMAIIMTLGLASLPEWRLWRASTFMVFPACFTSFLLLDNLVACKRINLRISERLSKKAAKAFFVGFILMISAGVMVLRFEGNYYLGQINHSSELFSLSFLFSKSQNSTITFVSWRSYVYSVYFNYNNTNKVLKLWSTDLAKIGGNQKKLLLSLSLLINQSDFSIRGMRDELDLYRMESPKATLKLLDESAIQSRFSQIYSNGYYRIYKRSIRVPP